MSYWPYFKEAVMKRASTLLVVVLTSVIVLSACTTVNDYFFSSDFPRFFDLFDIVIGENPRSALFLCSRG